MSAATKHRLQRRIVIAIAMALIAIAIRLHHRHRHIASFILSFARRSVKRLDLFLVVLVFVLLMAVSHKRVTRQHAAAAAGRAPAPTPTATLDDACACERAAARRAARRGFDERREWFDREPYATAHAQRVALQRLVSAERALQRERAQHASSEAWALLLDGDDAAQHYTHAALAHVRALRAMQRRSRDVLVLLNEAAFGDDVARLRCERSGRSSVCPSDCRSDSVVRSLVMRIAHSEQFVESGAKVVPLESLAYDKRRVALLKHVNKIQIWNLTQYAKIAFIDLDMTLHASLGASSGRWRRAAAASSPMALRANRLCV